MKKLLHASALLLILCGLNAKAFAGTLHCVFKNPESTVEGVKTLQITDDVLVVNETQTIDLEHSKIKCGQFGKQNRFDGTGNGLQVILKSCSDEAALEGHLIDSVNEKVAEVICDEMI